MPDTLSLSAGVSLGLLAGIVSGVCYLVANGLTWPRDEPKENRRCTKSIYEEELCRRCGGDKNGETVPCICRQRKSLNNETGPWLSKKVHRAATLMPWSLSTEKLEQIGRESPGPSDPTRGELIKIREFLETLSAKLAGGPLEGTRVAHLYDHPAYIHMFERHHTRLKNALASLGKALRDALTYLPAPRSAPSSASIGHRPTGASSAHVQLKRLVARVVEEAAALPALARYASEPSHSPSIESSTYEDLLASAILNKVIERYQNENGSGGRSSGIHSASASPTPSERSSPRSLHSRNLRDITPPLHEEEDVSDWEEGDATDDALGIPRRVPFPEFGGDIVHNTDNEERDFDDVSGSDLQAVDGTWEENWLFQRKKIKTIQSVPVPMLVPNSNTEYRALIGDRDADDTTDLSDNASETEETEYKSDIKRVLDSKHVIGGKSKFEEDFEPDSLTIVEDDFQKLVENEYKDNEKAVDDIINQINDNNVTIVESVNVNSVDKVDGPDVLVLGIDSGPIPKAEFALKQEIHRAINGHLEYPEEHANTNGDIFNGNLESHSSMKDSINTISHHEREGEYEETVTVPVQRYADSLRRKHFENVQEIPTRDTDQDDALIPGTIAYRERKKWENCVEMPNNPYSPEAIQKRLSSKSTSSLFDMITSKSIDLDDDKTSSDEVDMRITRAEPPVRGRSRLSMSFSNDSIEPSRSRSKSPTPKVLRDVLANEVPQYKRYGRDYYIREAKSSSGCRARGSSSDLSSSSSMNKATSLDNLEREFASPVSGSSSLSELEGLALHRHVSRAVLSPRHASPNFAINPIFESPHPSDSADDSRATTPHSPTTANKSVGLLIKQFNTIATNQQYTKFGRNSESVTITPNKDEILIEYEDLNENALFSAKPIVVDEETDRKFEEILQTAYQETPAVNHKDTNETLKETSSDTEPLKSPISVDASYISSSSLEDSIKIYNVQTGEIVKCKPDNVSDRYHDGSDNIDIDNEILEENVNNVSRSTNTFEEAENVSETNELDDILYQLPKVKELAKKFVSMENLNELKPAQPYTKRRKSKENLLNDTKSDKQPNKQVYMHSLTARSISREFREELKLSMATPLTVPGGSKEIPEGIEEVTNESIRPGSPVPEPGTIKTKLAFFESLKTKFNNNK
ncbi:hypothetical protein K1T71_002180 [Dendrolimus kikuchii]|uniref:Uncharacterized protein n=1 Tax=Dendrolimus kikuchii TaxID=765133 RepID=A0ACC1DG12_9NEOP|nr:hypothetical protein K1T71_002180 [Dendrolimus kikuchii]